MATSRIGQRRRAHLYIQEWIEFRGLSDEKVANRLGKARETVWRWRTEQHRLNPEKIAELASALDLEPAELYRPPDKPSLDALAAGLDDDLRNRAIGFIEGLRGRKAG